MIQNIRSIIDIKGKCQSVVKWRLTDACNYKCSYCLRYAWSNKTQDTSLVKQDNELAIKLIPEVARIVNEMPGKVKLDLIGGEVSLLDLDLIVDGIFKVTGSKLFRLNITTNMFRPAEYYTNLCNIACSYGAELGITCSWHSERCSFDEFFEKFMQIKSPTNQKGIRAECVSRVDNQEDVKRFIEKCEANNITYFIERDLNATPEEKQKLLIGSSKKKSDRYKIITDTGNELLFKTRNEVISGELVDFESYAKSTGYFCSRDYDYVYLEKDIHMGRIGNEDCKQIESIYDFHPLTEPKICTKIGCTLCGHMSIGICKDDLTVKEN